MSCCVWKKILLQSVLICVVGTGAGLIDSTLNPIKKHERVEPPSLPTNTTPTNGQQNPQPEPVGTTQPSVPTPPKTKLKPGEPGWTPTLQADMPKGQIPLDQAKSLFDQGATAVDARIKADYEAGHIKGALRINLKSFENGDPPLLAMIPRDANVLVYCSGGNCDESEHVAELLNGSGYKKVYIIHDGFPGWKAMGYPIDTGEGMQ